MLKAIKYRRLAGFVGYPGYLHVTGVSTLMAGLTGHHTGRAGVLAAFTWVYPCQHERANVGSVICKAARAATPGRFERRSCLGEEQERACSDNNKHAPKIQDSAMCNIQNNAGHRRHKKQVNC